MKKILFLFVAIQLSLSGIAFGQAKTYFHDRIDTTIFAVADTVGHGSNNYYATNTSPDFNVNHYENGLNVILFIKPGNSGPATLTLVTRTGTLSTRSIRKSPGAVLASGDIKDSCTMLFTYYNGHWRLGDMIPASSSSWMLTGNAGTVAATNFLGTTDAVDFVIRTNNTEKARISSAGVLSLGLASTNNGSLLFRNSTNANTLTINSGVTSASYALTLPTAQGAANTLLLNDGAGTLSWNTGAGLFWGLTGNAGTVAGVNFIGTTDAQDLVFNRNNIEVMRLYSASNFLGVGTATPTARIHSIGTTSDNLSLAFKADNSSNTILAELNNDGCLALGEAASYGNVALAIDYGTLAHPYQIYAHDGVNNNFIVKYDTKVGIGVDPTWRFDVRSSTNRIFNADFTNGYAQTAIGTDPQTSVHLYIQGAASRYPFVATGAVSAFNQVYITPTTQLIVNGSISSTTEDAQIKVKSSGVTSATFNQININSASTELFKIRDDGWLYTSLFGKHMADGSLNMTHWLSGNIPAISSNRNVSFGTNDAGTHTISGAKNTVIGSFQAVGITGSNNIVIGTTDIATPSSGSSNILFGSGGLNTITASSCLTFNGFTDASNEVVFGNQTYGKYASWWFGSGKSISSATGRYDINWYFTSITAGETDQAAIGNWIYNASAGTGTGAGGDFIWNTAPASTTGTTVNTLVEKLRLTSNGSLDVNGRLLKTQGADVASVAGAIAVGYDGNVFELTGTNAVTLLSNVGFQNGAEVTFVFTSTATITDGTANSGTDIGFECAGNANFVGSADDLITFILSEMGGTQRWREKSRSVN